MSNVELSAQAQQQLNNAATNLITHFSGKLQPARVSQVIGLKDVLDNGLKQDEKNRLFAEINKNPSLIGKLEDQIKENPALLDQAKTNPKAALEKMTGVDLDPPKPKAQPVEQAAPPSQHAKAQDPSSSSDLNSRFKDPLGVAGTGLANKGLIDKNHPVYDDTLFDNEFLDQVKAGKAGSAVMGANPAVTGGNSTNANTNIDNSNSDVDNSSQAAEVGNEGNAIPAEVLNAPGFNDFLNNLMADEAQGGLGLAEEVSGLMAGGAAGGAGFMKTLQGQLKDNPQLFEQMNDVIEGANEGQKAGLKERFKNVLSASGQGGDAMDMALADLQQYAKGVGMSNSPMGGMLGQLVEKFLPGITRMLDGILGKLGISGGAAGLLGSLGFGEGFMDGLTSKGAEAAAANLPPTQQQVLADTEKFFETNGKQIDDFMNGLNEDQASLLAGAFHPDAEGSISDRVEAFENSLDEGQKQSWGQWKAEGREIINQDPTMANSELGRYLQGSDVAANEAALASANEFGATLSGEQATLLNSVLKDAPSQAAYDAARNTFENSLDDGQKQSWDNLVGKAPSFHKVDQVGKAALQGKTDQITNVAEVGNESAADDAPNNADIENDHQTDIAAKGEELNKFLNGDSPVYGRTLSTGGGLDNFSNSNLAQYAAGIIVTTPGGPTNATPPGDAPGTAPNQPDLDDRYRVNPNMNPVV